MYPLHSFLYLCFLGRNNKTGPLKKDFDLCFLYLVENMHIGTLTLILVRNCKLTQVEILTFTSTNPRVLLQQKNASRKVQSNMALLFRSSEEYDERIDDE